MSKNYYSKILIKLNSQLSSLLLCSLDQTIKFDKELYSSANKTTHYIKHLIELNVEPEEIDMTIIEALTARNQAFVLPILFAIFIGSFSISTFDAIFSQNNVQLIIGIVIIISMLVLAKVLTNNQSPEIFPYSLIGLFGGPILDNIKVSITKPILSTDLVEIIKGSYIEIQSTSFFLILFTVLILLLLNKNNKLILFYRRSRFKKVFSIYQNYKQRIDELANIRESSL